MRMYLTHHFKSRRKIQSQTHCAAAGLKIHFTLHHQFLQLQNKMKSHQMEVEATGICLVHLHLFRGPMLLIPSAVVAAAVVPAVVL